LGKQNIFTPENKDALVDYTLSELCPKYIFIYHLFLLEITFRNIYLMLEHVQSKDYTPQHTKQTSHHVITLFYFKDNMH